MQIKVKKLHPTAELPIKATEHANGYDLTATNVDVDDYGNYVVHTHIAVEIPVGFVGLLFPRSSISKYPLRLANSVGVIDSDYRGEIMLKFKKDMDVQVSEFRKRYPELMSGKTQPSPCYNAFERCGQLLIVKAEIIDFVESDELSETARGDGGFGSTGA